MKRQENRTHTGDCRAARKTPKPKNMAKPTPQIQKISFICGGVIRSNEKELSHSESFRELAAAIG